MHVGGGVCVCARACVSVCVCVRVCEHVWQACVAACAHAMCEVGRSSSWRYDEGGRGRERRLQRHVSRWGKQGQATFRRPPGVI